jgi:hypothetical protein
LLNEPLILFLAKLVTYTNAQLVVPIEPHTATISYLAELQFALELVFFACQPSAQFLFFISIELFIFSPHGPFSKVPL